MPRPRGAADDAYARQWGSRLGRAWRGCGWIVCESEFRRGRGCGRASWDGRGPVRGSEERREAQVSRRSRYGTNRAEYRYSNRATS